MNYEQFIAEIQKYWNMRDRGLKKQANRFLFAFTKQMRWAFQIFGENYYPHNPERVHNPYHILEQVYEHPECDEQTVTLYFGKQLEYLWWGQHHFPEDYKILYGA